MSEADHPAVSIIIPALNEERSLAMTLDALSFVRGSIEIIVVDGGSDDTTREIARRSGAQVITGGRGRGIQMHSGAQAARGQALLFLHADTLLPPEAAEQISLELAFNPETVGGNFEIRFEGNTRPARFLTWLYPRLSKLGLSYGDSGIFVRASTYQQVGGFRPFPIFEDLDLVRRLKAIGRMCHLPIAVVTSSRRFEGRSFFLTFARWSILQGLYWAGVSPNRLATFYRPVRLAKSKATSGSKPDPSA